jgi:hypothetical protein
VLPSTSLEKQSGYLVLEISVLLPKACVLLSGPLTERSGGLARETYALLLSRLVWCCQMLQRIKISAWPRR